eukprot:jgi/Bigna1/57667/fgenesh1_pm.24_\
MSNPVRRRLMRDYKHFKKHSPQGIMAYADMHSVMIWHAIIFGPDNSPWEGGVFRLHLTFTDEYPNKPPKVIFISKMFHPNIYEDGNICLDILQNMWSPMLNLTAILTSIQSLLTDPNTKSPANKIASDMFVNDRATYHRQVMRHVELSWGLDEIGTRNI